MEAVVILLVPAIAFAVWAVAFFQPKSFDPVAERARSDQHIAWLEERLAYAREKNWDEQMIDNLLRQLEIAQQQQASRQAG